MGNQVERHEKWLEQMKAQSLKKQAAFITNISQRLGHPKMTAAPQHTFRGAPSFWSEKVWTKEQRIHQFSLNFTEVGAHVTEVHSLEEASEFIKLKSIELGAKKVIRQDEPILSQLNLEAKLEGVQTDVLVWNSNPQINWKAEAAQADFGIVRAEAAVAYTGSIVVKSSKEKGRSVSLLPTVLFIIIPESVIVTRLGEVLKTFDEVGRVNLPAGIHFISGPSRSSDIENDLTIGVHGPGIVFALVVNGI